MSKITQTVENEKFVKQPEVILDFEYQDGLLFIVIENIGNDSAHNTIIRFDKKILGMQKKEKISSLRIFRTLKFLPPGKKIKIFVDSFQFYLATKQPMQISVNILFRNKLGRRFQNTIKHDLTIYKDIRDVYSIKKIS
jgi:hypothetical protein